MRIECLVVCFLAVVHSTSALIEGLYCGTLNCYDVLELERGADAAAIRKSYRRLAVQYHPDKYKAPDAREKFQLLSTAYEILKDEEERTNYDYMLDHPDMVYRHYYNYYRKRVAPKVDVRVVIAGAILVISVIQYLGWWHSYNRAIKAALLMPQYRTRAKQIAEERRLLPLEKSKTKKVPKEVVKNEEEAILWSILEDNLNIIGGYSKPRIWDVLLFKILVSPYSLLLYLWWYGQWVWQFNIKKMEYGPEEKCYLTRRSLNLSQARWEALSAENRADLVSKELWVGDHLQSYKKEQEEEMKTKLADSSKHKMYRRYMKSHRS